MLEQELLKVVLSLARILAKVAGTFYQVFSTSRCLKFHNLIRAAKGISYSNHNLFSSEPVQCKERRNIQMCSYSMHHIHLVGVLSLFCKKESSVTNPRNSLESVAAFRAVLFIEHCSNIRSTICMHFSLSSKPSKCTCFSKQQVD